jgi:hypothetical protein
MMTMPSPALLFLLACVLISSCQSFISISTTSGHRIQRYQSSAIDSEPLPLNVDDLEDLKSELVRTCKASPKPSLDLVRSLVQQVEGVGEQLGIGQSSSSSGLLSGEWYAWFSQDFMSSVHIFISSREFARELLYSPEDMTRSSPFFWAFRRAFPDQSDEIFSITDAIPAPIKEVGPAYQEIELSNSTFTGKFVSRVKVATLGGLATSIMTTRASIVGVQGLDGIRLKIETTKPEESTAVKTLFGPLGDVVNENLPPFPSGEVLERVMPGSSEVIMRNTYCDEELRISRNDDDRSGVYVWQRKKFAVFETI